MGNLMDRDMRDRGGSGRECLATIMFSLFLLVRRTQRMLRVIMQTNKFGDSLGGV